MVRCGCASDQCGCNFIAGDGVVISGTGSRSNPYVIEAVVPVSSGGGGTDGRFTGEITKFAGAVPPAGWLICDGRAVNRAVYSGLYDVIGTTYGAGDGSTTFNLPDFEDRGAVGASSTRPLGTQAGSSTHLIAVENLPSHHHTIAHAHDMSHGHTGSVSAGGGHDHNAYWNATDGSDVGTYSAGAISGRAKDNNALVDWQDNHGHGLGINNFNGGTGGSNTPNSGDTGSGTPVNHEPPTVAVHFLIHV